MGRQRENGTTAALESSIMDLWDQGVPMQQISERLGISRRAVKRVFGYMVDGGEGARSRRDMVAGSKALAAAITAARSAQ